MKEACVVLAHGGGGELTKALLEEHILPKLANQVLDTLSDGALLELPSGRLCVATDASVVQPLFFEGGDIGRLAVSGTVNDLAVMGAQPRYLTMSFILEEGLPLAQLDRVLDSVAATAREAGVWVVAGDTKVVERVRGDGLYLSTSGVGVMPEGVSLGLNQVQEGDVLLLSGTIADHGLAILAARGELGLRSSIASDVAPLSGLCAALLELGSGLRFMRDPTRGGLAGVLVDVAEGTGMSVEVDEEKVPISRASQHACELLGLDPLNVANEGKLLVVVAAELAQRALELCAGHERGRKAALIGRVVQQQPPLVELLTRSGGRRIVSRPYGEDLPRIC
ncbi:MAG: hydrogenase expression/formation protein HypE [Myxococcota bacterium]|nr:hydrogenase expression/formation protein HypE [Myxococcota bacterium]